MNYDERLNRRVREMPVSGIRKFFDIAAEMKDCISLGVGEPDFVTPWEIREAAIKSIQSGKTAYTSNAGLIELRREISTYLKNRFGLDYAPEHEIITTVGASEAIDMALRTLVTPGDEVLIPAPSYVSYSPNVSLVGGEPREIPLVAEERFTLTPERLEAAITDKSKVLVFPFPNNPTGAIMTRDEIEKLVPVILKHDLLVISDEIYAELTYGGISHVSIASFEGMRERTIVVNGFSKAFAMTGWRLGYFAAPEQITRQAYKIHQYTIMCAPTFAQYGGVAALKISREDDFAMVKTMRDSYDRRRKFLHGEFNKMGLKCFEPRGAFYVFPSVEVTGLTGEEFAEKLLYAKHVAVVPGSAFGSSGKYFVRCCYATAMNDLKRAVALIREFLTENGWLK